MAASTAPACKAAILAILTADSGLDAVDKRWAPPTEEEDYGQEPQAIYFGTVEIDDNNWSALGRNQGQGTRRESYWLSLTVLIAQFGDDPRTAEERAWEVWAQVEDDLRTDLFSGSSLLVAAGVRQFDEITATQNTGVWGPHQWAARVDARIHFKNHHR